MKKLILALLLSAFLIFTPNVKAQTRVLLGVNGVNDFNNLSAGISASIEQPIGKHFEVDLLDAYSPYEQKVGLGKGHANFASVGSTLWLNKIGITGKIEDSGYTLTQLSKSSIYATGGLTYRRYVLGMPARLGIGYIQQVNNGIFNGVETSHLKGVYLKTDTRLGCTGSVCYRMTEEFNMGQVLEQGSPTCDGTYSILNTCPRTKATGGGVSLTFAIEFPRHKDRNKDYDLF